MHSASNLKKNKRGKASNRIKTRIRFEAYSLGWQRRWTDRDRRRKRFPTSSEKIPRSGPSKGSIFSDVLVMRLWYVPSCDGTCHHWHQIYLFKANDDTQLHRIGAIFAPSRFCRQKGKLRFRLHAKSSAKMKEKVRAILDSNKPTSNEHRNIKQKQIIKRRNKE